MAETRRRLDSARPGTHSWLAYTIIFLRLGRAHFLAGGLVLYGLGGAVALYAGARLNLPALLWGQAAITAIQLMTHYSNDYFDAAADRLNHTPTSWSGGSRVLVNGLLLPAVALVAAQILATGALLVIAVLGIAIRRGALTWMLYLLMLVLSWGYSAPPLQLQRRGLGPIVVLLVVSTLTPLAGFYLQAGKLTLLPILAILPLCCLQLAMQFGVDLPDLEGDQAAGKRTAVVRLGRPRAVRLYSAALMATYALLPLLVLAGLPPLVALAAALPLPLAAWQMSRVSRGMWGIPAAWNSLVFWTVALLMGTAAAETIAFLVLRFLL